MCRVITAQVLPFLRTDRYMAVADLLDTYPAKGLSFQERWISVSHHKTSCRNMVQQKATYQAAISMCSTTYVPEETKEDIRAQ